MIFPSADLWHRLRHTKGTSKLWLWPMGPTIGGRMKIAIGFVLWRIGKTSAAQPKQVMGPHLASGRHASARQGFRSPADRPASPADWSAWVPGDRLLRGRRTDAIRTWRIQRQPGFGTRRKPVRIPALPRSRSSVSSLWLTCVKWRRDRPSNLYDNTVTGPNPGRGAGGTKDRVRCRQSSRSLVFTSSLHRGSHCVTRTR